MGRIIPQNYPLIGASSLTDNDVFLVETVSGTRTMKAKDIADTYTKQQIRDTYVSQSVIQTQYYRKDQTLSTQEIAALDTATNARIDTVRTGLENSISSLNSEKAGYLEYSNATVDLHSLSDTVFVGSDVYICNFKGCTLNNAPSGISNQTNGYVIYSKHDSFHVTAELTVYNGNYLEKYYNYTVQTGSTQKTWSGWVKIAVVESRLRVPDNSDLNGYHGNTDGIVIYYLDGATGIRNEPTDEYTLYGYLVVSKHIKSNVVHVEQTLYASGNVYQRRYEYDPQLSNYGSWSSWRDMSDSGGGSSGGTQWHYVQDNDDLNDYKGESTGVSFYDLSWATGLQHTPVTLGRGAYLTVARHQHGSQAIYVEQTLYYLSNIYTRYFFYDPDRTSASAWSGWVKMATADDVDDLQSQIDNIHTGGEYPNADSEEY